MNFAKTALSAPVKKSRPGESADPPGRLAYPIFFFYLRWARQFSASFNQVEQLKAVSTYDGAEIFEGISEKGA